MSPYLQVLLPHLLDIVVTVVGVGLIPLAHFAYKRFSAWLGIKITAEQEAMLDQVLLRGVGHAEQWAKVKLKSEGAKPPSAEKLDAALKFVEEELKRLGYEDLAKEKLQKLLEAKLGQA
jgi:hypothetical protein